MAQCYEHFDNGHVCRRKATRLNGSCGKCHGITEEWKHCTQPARGKYCGRDHRTLDEIVEHRARARRSRSSSRRTNIRNLDRGPNTATSKYSYGPPRRPSGTSRTGRRTGTGSLRSPNRKAPSKPRRQQKLSVAAKHEAAKICADAIVGQGVLAAFDAQIADYVSSELIDKLSKNWDGKQCDELAKLARGLLTVKGYFYRIIQIALNWLMLKLGYGDTARIFACQLVCALPVAWYAKLVTAARILQITGICLCFANDRKLTECECLHDLVLFEGKDAIGRLMTAAVNNWREIATGVPEISVPS
jgi:hypothetical protein